MTICTLETIITVFRIGNRQLVGGCRFGLVFLNRQLNRQLQSESAIVAKIGYQHSKLDNNNLSFRIGNRQLVAGCRFGLVFLNRQLNRQLVSESLTGDREGFWYAKDRYGVIHYRPSICPCRIRVENALKTHVIRISFPTRISKIQSKPTFDTR